ncbi:hypothetical protein GCM10019817_03620 [Lactobacillus intestinalis]
MLHQENDENHHFHHGIKFCFFSDSMFNIILILKVSNSKKKLKITEFQKQ